MDWPKLYETDWFKSRPANVQAAMKKYPVEKFYQKKDDSHNPIRVYGIVENADGTVDRAHVIIAHKRVPHGIVGGYSLDDLEEVKEWSENQLWIIKTMDSDNRNAFLEKDGVEFYILNGPYSGNNQNYQYSNCGSCGHCNSN